MLTIFWRTMLISLALFREGQQMLARPQRQFSSDGHEHHNKARLRITFANQWTVTGIGQHRSFPAYLQVVNYGN
jgi:hypothetical protein